MVLTLIFLRQKSLTQSNYRNNMQVQCLRKGPSERGAFQTKQETQDSAISPLRGDEIDFVSLLGRNHSSCQAGWTVLIVPPNPLPFAMQGQNLFSFLWVHNPRQKGKELNTLILLTILHII